MNERLDDSTCLTKFTTGPFSEDHIHLILLDPPIYVSYVRNEGK